jgi:hypothetical protein
MTCPPGSGSRSVGHLAGAPPAFVYPGEASDDGSPHIFVHPVLSDSTPVAGTVVHQLCHAALGNGSHGAQFKMLATATGLVGKMTQTIEGPMFLAIMSGIIDRIGPYPRAALRQIRGLEKSIRLQFHPGSAAASRLAAFRRRR